MKIEHQGAWAHTLTYISYSLGGGGWGVKSALA